MANGADHKGKLLARDEAPPDQSRRRVTGVPASQEGRRPRGRPSLDEARKLRETLLAVALEEFHDHGFDAASMDVIAKRAGIGRKTIYRKFSNKKNLYRQSVEMGLNDVANKVETFLSKPGDPEETLRARFESLSCVAVPCSSACEHSDGGDVSPSG